MSGSRLARRLLVCLLVLLPGGVAAARGASGAGVTGNAGLDCVRAKSTPVASFPFNPFLLRELSPPVVGPASAWRARLATETRGPGVAYLFAARSAAYMPLPGGVLLVDMDEAIVLQVARFEAGEELAFSVPIPDDDRLCGQRVRVQAVIVDARGALMTNAFDLTLGR